MKELAIEELLSLTRFNYFKSNQVTRTLIFWDWHNFACSTPWLFAWH